MIEAFFDSESGTTLHQSHWSGVRNLTGVIGKVSDVVSVVHVHHDFSSRKGACLAYAPFSRSLYMITTLQ